jgi:hypothetical protein
VKGPPPHVVGRQQVKVSIEQQTKMADYGKGQLGPKNKKKMSKLEWLSDQKIKPK